MLVRVRKQLYLLHNTVCTNFTFVSSVDALSADSLQLQHIARCILLADGCFSSALPHSDIYSNTV
jgi:hypothetical protein